MIPWLDDYSRMACTAAKCRGSMLAAGCAKSDFCQSNTAFVAGENDVPVAGPGVTGAEPTTLSQDLKALDLPPTMVFSRHPHWDNMFVGSRPRRWVTPRAV